jgi:two-component system CheB/CheR fusion protein
MARAKPAAPEAAELIAEIIPAKTHFPIVGIGASAGGLAAFEAFFSGMPADKDPGMAFVLVQHLAPDHKSILTELIRRYTRMQVFEVADGVEVQPNCAYIIPPNCDMAFLNGTLQLLEPVSARGQRLPIDFFFRSLAQDQHELAICIVLSGTGSDGTLGLRAIKGEGGMAMVQNPESAEYDGMPRSAINTGLVDYVLPAADIPAQLIAYSLHAFGRPPRPSTVPEPKTESELKKIFVILRAQTGHDFSQYKPSTINRRVERRMAVHQINRLDGYVKYLQQTPQEVEALFRDLLIGVTNFFRDPEAFAVLETAVIPRIFADKPPGSTFRVWICGCSTGEEAYSIAILLQEYVEKLKQNYMIQLFATDIDKQAIDQARKGFFPLGIANDITPERLSRFFTLETDGKSYRIHKGIRDMLVLSEQDVIKDPPFSKLDLITCRNLMIYMGGELQKKLIPLFHYALNPGGFLLLGTSETVGEFATLFDTTDRKQKLYQRKDDAYNAQRVPLATFTQPISATDASLQQPAIKKTFPQNLPLQALAEQALLGQVVQAGILVNRQGEILYLHGRTGMYLELATGGAGNYNILKMAREGLRPDLMIALHKAATQNELVRRPGLRVKTNSHFTTVNLSITPVTAMSETTLFMVILEEAAVQLAEIVSDTPGETPDTLSVGTGDPLSNVDGFDRLTTSTRLATLQLELRAKEEYIQCANEELQASNEELKSSNEELQSINEEMQSTNEELETSKEELQSVNEELATINAELQTKVLDLSRVNNDMNNLLAGTGIGTVFVDHQLRILRFTPGVTQIINLIESDIGRSVAHFASNLVAYDCMVADVQGVLNSLIPKEAEVQTTNGNYYLMRIIPYRTTDNKIEGAVINFLNITENKHTRDALKKANDLNRMAVVVRDAHDAIVMQNMKGRILAWNPAAERMYGWSESEALERDIRELIPEGLRKEDIERVHQLSRKEAVEPYRTQRLTKDGATVEVWLTATALLNEAGQVYAIATTERASGVE